MMARGRKPKPLLWEPNVMDIVGPVYVESVIKTDLPMHRVLEGLASLDQRFPSDSHVRQYQHYITRWAMSDVIRRKWNPKMTQAYLGQNLDRSTRLLIQKEGLILTKLLRIVSETFLIAPSGFRHPAIWWGLCCVEGCSLVRRRHISAPAMTKSADIKDFEAVNASLKRGENPFILDNSKLLFDKAIALSESTKGTTTGDDFYSQAFKPYLDARAEMSAFLKKKGLALLRENKSESK